MADDVTGHRIDALERAVRKLQAEQVSPQWLDERFGRLRDQIGTIAEDVSEIKQADRSRRMAVYTAVVVGVVSLVSALVMVGLGTGAGPV